VSELFGPWRPDLDECERRARWRELRALAFLIVGPRHRLTSLLRRAERGSDRAARAAWELLAELEPLKQRRLLSLYAELSARSDNDNEGVP